MIVIYLYESYSSGNYASGRVQYTIQLNVRLVV